MNGRVTGSADRIELQGLSATGYHGVLEEERRDGQLFVVDLVLELDLGPAARRDDLALTVDYAHVAGVALSRVTGPPVRLIETLAESIAADVLSDDAVDAVEVTVHKPHAPIGHLVGDVRVRVRRERGTPAVVALGGNVGDRRETLTQAVDELAALPGVSVESVSPLVESDAVGGPEQPRYLNAVVLVRTSRSPWHLLSGLHSIEARHGRVREVRWGARTLDLDLVQFGGPDTAQEVLSAEADLLLPHPRAGQRAFVLVPWARVDPDARLRLGSRSSDPIRAVTDLVAELDVSGITPGPGWGQQW